MGTLNVRSGPGTSHAVIGRVFADTQVEIVQPNAVSGWHKIWHSSQEAFVSSDYIKLNDDLAPETKGVITASVLNVRQRSGYIFLAVGSLKKGDSVDIITLNAAPKWHKIVFGGSAAYVHADYVNTGSVSAPGTGSPLIYAAVNASAVNFRQSPSTGSKILKTLSRGEVVQILESGTTWHKVKHGGIEGYMFAQYITPSSTLYGTVSASVLNVRSSASTSASVLGRLVKDETVEITQAGSTWHKIRYRSSTAYVYASYIKLS